MRIPPLLPRLIATVQHPPAPNVHQKAIEPEPRRRRIISSTSLAKSCSKVFPSPGWKMTPLASDALSLAKWEHSLRSQAEQPVLMGDLTNLGDLTSRRTQPLGIPSSSRFLSPFLRSFIPGPSQR
ncbi:hypothetical protein MPNT_10170 [Candidatus Methylacidithermus pantelleriae]|uniref:Uncharacterized protein n=1 Tax=Candidatus Methylacidithermus pantelleriae TaxID=2744239 RepID=A0A8J2BM67_9BACT|nr:hypothetical protein MPNT_10170 [Candidatus Methylacidithermus pantelleriae]